MRIGLLGWYHQNNAGDDRILECLSKKLSSLGVKHIEVFIAWDDLNYKISSINQCDFLIIGGGGLVLRQTNRVAALLNNVKIPFGFLGISVDSVGEDNSKFIQYIAKKASFVLVRDSYSFKVFKDFNTKHLYQAADLTFLYPYQPYSTKYKHTNIALSLRHWRPNPFKQYTKNYHRFNQWTHKIPFLPKLLNLWNEKDFVDRLKRIKPNQIIPFPLHLCDDGCDNQLLSKYFNDQVKKEFDIEILRNSHYLIGMRLHSLIFATQLGVPFIALNYANKVAQFAKTVHMEDYVLNLKDYKAITNFTHKIEPNIETLSKRLLETTKVFQQDVNQTVDSIFNTHIQ